MGRPRPGVTPPRSDEGYRDRQAQGGGRCRPGEGRKEASHPKGAEDPVDASGWGVGRETLSPGALSRSPTCLHPDFRLLASDCERINFCCLKLPQW